MTARSEGPLPGSATPTPADASATAAPALSERELKDMQAAEEAKGDPALDDVPSAEIDVPDEKEEPFEKLAAAARRLSEARVRTLVETLLFLAERPLAIEEMRQATGVEPARIEKALDQISGHHREGISGIVLHEVAGGWQLRTSPDNADFRSGSPARRSRRSPSSPTASRSRARRSRRSAGWTAVRW